ncbi:MAG: hypothetical protein COU07_00620 [Candidatus Harrisonbacteria bacterium CG10_big_fil_rev_8_21_14_0_10_40_38]|uniref:YgjP-like metallopeptidase domain-containing protein n=1 Tax=Candidatus Harrisonbacteria bacterium CG10_big_fil_rev_8_21_14_0_10_40_38 TaxID=1974583 RepID=A0A2H0USK2_9BACT|nr:MAG: hypothetical protein COU07_00620 [Candidatus Harrisonbacteria bacterium CG10_big_fil_rev_8_21_14_0_10_40_38]
MRLTKFHYKKYKEDARRLIHERVGYFNQIYDHSFNRIFIKNQKTCWGSCSEKRNLNFNYKLFFLPAILRDYVIVHELCHLEEFNHSPRFWGLVSRVFPDYRKLRRELKIRNYEL